MWRIVLEASESRWIVRWRDDNTISEAMLSAAIVAEDRMRDNRGGGVAIGRVDHHVDAITRQNFQGSSEGWLGERVCIETYVKRAIVALLFAVETDCLSYREDMCFVE
jgi:hypothetical protein